MIFNADPRDENIFFKTNKISSDTPYSISKNYSRLTKLIPVLSLYVNFFLPFCHY